MDGEEAGELYIPQESWLKVFSYLTPHLDGGRVSLTCKLWLRLWQDKQLWKMFHATLLGGKPKPPLLPKAWMKSFGQSIRFLFDKRSKCWKLDRSALEHAIKQGHIAAVDRILSSATTTSALSNFLDPPPEKVQSYWRPNRHFNLQPKSALELALQGGKDMVQFLIEKYYQKINSQASTTTTTTSTTPSTATTTSSTPSDFTHPKIRSFVHDAVIEGHAESLRYIFSISQQARESARTDSLLLSFSIQLHGTEILDMMVNLLGVPLTQNNLSEAIRVRSTACAHFILDYLQQQQQQPQHAQHSCFY